MKQSINVQGEHGHQGVPKRMLTAFSGSTGDRQTTQLSLLESKEDNAARGAATVLKTDVYPCTLM